MQANNLRLKKCDCTDFIDWLIENCTQWHDRIDKSWSYWWWIKRKKSFLCFSVFFVGWDKGCLERQNSRHDPSFVPHFGWHRWKSFTWVQRLGDHYFPTHFQKLAYQHEVLTILSYILALPILVYFIFLSLLVTFECPNIPSPFFVATLVLEDADGDEPLKH